MTLCRMQLYCCSAPCERLNVSIITVVEHPQGKLTAFDLFNCRVFNFPQVVASGEWQHVTLIKATFGKSMRTVGLGLLSTKCL